MAVLGVYLAAVHPTPAQPPQIQPCGEGTLTIILAGAPAGEERYRIDCLADGSYRGQGASHVRMGGLTADFTIRMIVDSALIPRRVIASGSSGLGPMDDSLELRGAGTVLVRGGKPMPVPAAEDAAYIGNNLFWPMPFVLGRYDRSAGGEQQIPAFPSTMVRVSYAGADTVAPAMLPSRVFHRFTLNTSIAMWVTPEGRYAGLSAPQAKLIVLDVRDAAYAEGLARAVGATVALRTPDYSAPAGAPFTAEEVTVDAGTHTLAGTLLVPRGSSAPWPAAITITGSGQQERDESLPMLARYAPFREIAEALAGRGIAVLRVDDRGTGGSTGAETLGEATSRSFADDVRAQLRFLRARRDIAGDRIALIGHSEGALIAPLVAAGDSSVAALVLMAGTAYPGDSVLYEQVGDLLARDTAMSPAAKESARLAHRETVRKLAAGEPVPGVPNVAWMRHFITTDPREALAGVHQPTLVLQGDRDRQVFAHHADAIAATLRASGNADVTVRHYPDLNHLFLPSATGAVAEYAALEEQSLPRTVLDAIADWLVPRLR